MKVLITIILSCLLVLPLGCKDSEAPFGCMDKSVEKDKEEQKKSVPPIEHSIGTPMDAHSRAEELPKMTATGLENGISVNIGSQPFGDPVIRTISLIWDANTETDLAGYRLYYGASPRPSTVISPDQSTYTTMIPIPNPSAVTYNIDLPTGNYYFALTAYDIADNESNFSNEAFASVLDAPQNFIVSFRWDIYPQADIIDGFKIYYGTEARSIDITAPYQQHPYTEVIVAPGATLVSFSTLIPEGDYYFTLTAYSNNNPTGYEDSPFSNEVYASIPVAPRYPEAPDQPSLTPIS